MLKIRILKALVLPYLSASQSKRSFTSSVPYAALGAVVGMSVYRVLKQNLGSDEEKKRADEYFPVQSDSERAANHPLVGSV